jgi:hypothetical protein
MIVQRDINEQTYKVIKSLTISGVWKSLGENVSNIYNYTMRRRHDDMEASNVLLKAVRFIKESMTDIEDAWKDWLAVDVTARIDGVEIHYYDPRTVKVHTMPVPHDFVMEWLSDHDIYYTDYIDLIGQLSVLKWRQILKEYHLALLEDQKAV